MITGYGSSEKAVEAMRAGAFYYVEKPVDFDELNVLIDKAIERKRQSAEIKELRNKLTDVESYEGIIGGSREMQNIYEMIESVADSDANILILGESGTGKEVIANAIHYKSERAKRPFVKVNCSALPKELIESHLFGHVKGAFTGANKDKDGLIARASGGSLLLDEIGEMPIDLQPKLLRVLQEKVFYKVGSDDPCEADFRLITATNRVPFEAIKEGSLREDLYYRINTIELVIPPLRDRQADVPMLAEHFLSMYSEKYAKGVKTFTDKAYDEMLNYRWRGNVRELQHVIERAVLLTKNEKIETVFPQGIAAVAGAPNQGMAYRSVKTKSPALPEIDSIHSEDDTVEEIFRRIGEMIVETLPEGNDDSEKSERDVFGLIEREVVSAALKKNGGNKQATAKMLGLYRPRLYGMLKRHNIEH